MIMMMERQRGISVVEVVDGVVYYYGVIDARCFTSSSTMTILSSLLLI